MFKFRLIVIFTVLFSFIFTSANSDISFIDMDKVLSSTKVGSSVIKQIIEIEKVNSVEFKKKVEELKDKEAKINNLTQNISVKINDEYNFKKKIILNEKNKTFQLLIPVALDQIADSKNYMINFNTSGQITEFDVLKSPDRKKIGFKINYIKLQKL